MNILILEDNPHRITFFQNGLKPHKVTICRHSKAAIRALKRETFDVIFLDHDLDGEPADPETKNSGSEVARFIADSAVVCPCIILHTENRQGSASMESILSQARSIPYSKLKKIGLRSLLKMVIEP